MHMRSDQSHASFDDVSLIGAKVVGDVDMVGVRINGILNAHALQVGGSLVLQLRRQGAPSRVRIRWIWDRRRPHLSKGGG